MSKNVELKFGCPAVIFRHKIELCVMPVKISHRAGKFLTWIKANNSQNLSRKLLQQLGNLQELNQLSKTREKDTACVQEDPVWGSVGEWTVYSASLVY